MSLPSDVIILDDFMPKGFVDRLEATVTSDRFKWFFLDNITRSEIPRKYNSDIEFKDCWGLSHSIFHDKEWYDPYSMLQYSLMICETFADKTDLSFDWLYRMKVNQSLKGSERLINYPHIDNNLPHDVLLYYVNDSDGPTYLYDRIWHPDDDGNTIDLKVIAEIEPKKGRAVKFDGLRYHSSSTPTDNLKRIALNINLGFTNAQ